MILKRIVWLISYNQCDILDQLRQCLNSLRKCEGKISQYLYFVDVTELDPCVFSDFIIRRILYESDFPFNISYYCGAIGHILIS